MHGGVCLGKIFPRKPAWKGVWVSCLFVFVNICD